MLPRSLISKKNYIHSSVALSPNYIMLYKLAISKRNLYLPFLFVAKRRDRAKEGTLFSTMGG